ncbi:MAG: DUF4834 family protein [Bacteroidales bacterium]
MGFLKFLLIFFTVTYILGIIGRLIIRRFLKKTQHQFEQQQAHQRNQYKNEGDVTIQNKSNSEKIIDQSEGEYIDYEEIK